MKKFEDINYIKKLEDKSKYILINYDLLEIHETSKSKVKKSLESLLNNYLNKIVEIINMKVVDITNINVDEYLINFKFDSKFNLSQHEVNRILGEEDYIVSEIIDKLANINKRTFTLPLRMKYYEEYIVPAIIKKNNINYLTLYIIIHLALIYSLSKEYIN